MINQEYIKAQDLDIAYRILGEGEPLLLILGFGGTMAFWDSRLMDLLARHHQLILFDNRGMGGTKGPPGLSSMEQFARDALNLLDALRVERTDVLGWSMGSNIAIEMYFAQPKRIKKMILYAADCGGREATFSPDVIRTLYDTRGTIEERRERFFRMMFPSKWIKTHPNYLMAFSSIEDWPSPASIQRQAKANDQWKGCFHRLSALRCPTLLVTGTEDQVTPPLNSLLMVQKIQGAWLAQVEECGHGLMYQAPEILADISSLFLRL
jgi:pimeloyl-ACP methyl ester carboxylesterase